MGIIFNANEVFEMAKQIEINGAAFYRKAAQNNPQSKKLLLEIASQEDEHLKIFGKMQKAIASLKAETGVFDPDNEGGLYLKALADAKVFNVKNNPASLLKGAEKLQDIIRLAIGLEKDSIIFYLGIKEMVPKKLGEDKIMAIVKEEMNHISWLGDKL